MLSEVSGLLILPRNDFGSQMDPWAGRFFAERVAGTGSRQEEAPSAHSALHTLSGSVLSGSWN